ncbi:MAG: phage head-tail connector protein [Alphaproteobacteria bacterium]|nr:phage head-tail connector protein [Alphaproteobacteria bacterium]
MAAGDLTSLANVKSWLNISSTDHDADLTRLISACSGFMQQWMNRTFAVSSYNEVRNGPGISTVMVTANYPLISVSSVTIDGVSIPVANGTFNSQGYTFDQRNIYLAGGYSFARGKANVLISYTAGYATLPLEIEQACIETVGSRWRERDRIGMASKALAGETTAFSLKDFPAQVITLMNNYKKVIPL